MGIEQEKISILREKYVQIVCFLSGSTRKGMEPAFICKVKTGKTKTGKDIRKFSQH